MGVESKAPKKTLVPDFKRDVQEWYVRETLPKVLDTLLLDRTMSAENGRPTNIVWGTDDYLSEYGAEYAADKPILPEQIADRGRKVICPRVDKRIEEQRRRSVEKAEVFTPSWVCNKQNNLVDAAWFGRKTRLFNAEKQDPATGLQWTANADQIEFPDTDGRRWEDYIAATRLEVSCGEAPYLTSRYDSTTGAMIAVSDRIGLLDRKLRIVTERCGGKTARWIALAKTALRNVYGFEWQGDNVVLARENLLYAVLEAFGDRFKGRQIPAEEIEEFAEIISWNIFQMDGIKFVVPNTCHDEEAIPAKKPEDFNLTFSFMAADCPETQALPLTVPCPGCKTGDATRHNGVRCRIMDWKAGKQVLFMPPFDFPEAPKERK